MPGGERLEVILCEISQSAQIKEFTTSEGIEKILLILVYKLRFDHRLFAIVSFVSINNVTQISV